MESMIMKYLCNWDDDTDYDTDTESRSDINLYTDSESHSDSESHYDIDTMLTIKSIEHQIYNWQIEHYELLEDMKRRLLPEAGNQTYDNIMQLSLDSIEQEIGGSNNNVKLKSCIGNYKMLENFHEWLTLITDDNNKSTVPILRRRRCINRFHDLLKNIKDFTNTSLIPTAIEYELELIQLEKEHENIIYKLKSEILNKIFCYDITHLILTY